MFDLILGFLGKFLGSLIPVGWKYAIKRWFRPVVESRKAPANLFEYISPTSSKENIKEILGAPHRVHDDIWFYRFKDALIQIEFWPDNGAKYIALALTTYSDKNGFILPMLGKPLGKITLADAMEDEGQLQYRRTNRTEELVWLTSIGVPGAWSNYSFGALWPLTPGYLDDTKFSWDYEKNELVSNPEDVHINWIAVSNSSDEIYFDWTLALPAYNNA